MEPIKKIYKIGSEMNIIQNGSGGDCRADISDIVERIVDISLKLAYNGCYDNTKRLIFNGSPMNGTNVAELLTNAMYNFKNNNKPQGNSEFLFILRKLGVAPENCVNNNIKRQLSKRIKVEDKIADSQMTGPTVLTNIEEIRERKVDNFYPNTPEASGKKLKNPKTTFRRSPYQLRKKNAVFWIIPK